MNFKFHRLKAYGETDEGRQVLRRVLEQQHYVWFDRAMEVAAGQIRAIANLDMPNR